MIEREIKQKIIDTFKLKEITVLIGARQVGKTTILKQIFSKLENAVYFNLDIEQDAEYLKSQQSLLNKLELELGKNQGFVFIDEIQQKQDAGRFLKGLYDMDLPYKFIVTGSGSLELKQKIKESLAGRKYLMEMPSVTFTEFVNYKTNYKYKNRLPNFFEIETTKTKLYLDEYLRYGGYPAVITATRSLRKKEIMDEIFTSYVSKDISYLLNVRYPDKFIRMLQLLAVQTGSILNYDQLANDVGVRVETLKNYMWYAEHTFIINIVRPFFTNLKKEITKSPTVYFNDVGLCNYLRGSLDNSRIDGMIFQNFIYLLLKQKYQKPLAKINFWRNKEKAEVDFIVHKDNEIIPVEVKYSELKKETISRSFRSFIQKYAPKTAFLVNLSLDSKIKIDDTEVLFIPFWKLYRLANN